MNSFVGFDLGTSNVTMTQIFPDKIYSDHLVFEPDSNPYDIHTKITSFVITTFSLPSEPPVVKIESVFKGPNQRTFSRMTRVAHSIYIASRQMTDDVEYIEPSVWRKVLFDKGNKKKLECQEWAYENYPFLLDYPKKTRDHRADSLMVALAGKKLHESDI